MVGLHIRLTCQIRWVTKEKCLFPHTFGTCSLLQLYLGAASHWRAWEIACWKSEFSLHAIILATWQFYYIESELWCHMTRKNQKIAQGPHLLGRFNACKNSVCQVLPFLCTCQDKAMHGDMCFWIHSKKKEDLVTSHHGLTVAMDSTKTKPLKLLAGLQ